MEKVTGVARLATCVNAIGLLAGKNIHLCRLKEGFDGNYSPITLR